MTTEQNESPLKSVEEVESLGLNHTILEVRQFGSQERCDMPGYFRYFEAVDEHGKSICVVREPSDPGAKDNRVFVRSERVWSQSGTGYEAIRRFLEWETSGKPRSWLLNP